MKISGRQYARVFVDLAADAEPAELDRLARAFIDYLAERNDLRLWREIVRQIDFVWRERFGVSKISVVSAHPLTSAAAKALERAACGASVDCSVDSDLIGGAVVRIDDRIIDASVSGHLHRLKTALMN